MIIGYIVLAIVVFAVLMMIIITIIAASEKQETKPFTPSVDPRPPGADSYFLAMGRAAHEMGFTHGGTVTKKKGRLIDITAAFWLSPEHETLALVGSGRIAGKAYKKTALFSYMEYDRLLVTQDEFGEHDYSGIFEITVLMNANLPELYQRHRQLLAVKRPSPKRFTPDNMLAQYEGIEYLRVQRLINLGLARMIEVSRGIWKYTFKGALKMGVLGFLTQLGQGVGQMDRQHMKRPGA